MGLFGGDSKTVKRTTNITTTKVDTDTETVTGVKATDGSKVTQAGGDIGLTGARFENVATGITSALSQGVQAIATGAQVAQRQSTERLRDARQISAAATQSSPIGDGGGTSSAGGGKVALVVGGLLLLGLAAWGMSR